MLQAGCITAAALASAAHAQNRPAAQKQKGTDSKMHLGIVTYNVASEWDLDTILKICRNTRMEAVEFRTGHKHGVEPTLGATQRLDLKAKLAASGLKQISLGSTCEFNSDAQDTVNKNIQSCADFVTLAKSIGARAVKVRPNGLVKGLTPEQSFEQIGKALARCGKFAEDNGVEIWMEVHGGPTQMPAAAHSIMQACGHKNVGLTWNSNHTEIEKGSVKAAFELLQPWIRCCHITELWNDYPWRELFGLLKKSGYDRYTLCEIGAVIRPEDGEPFLNCYRRLWEEFGA